LREYFYIYQVTLMSISLYIKKISAVPLNYYIKYLNIIKSNKRHDEFLVVMYHRIITKNNSNIYIQDGMYVDPDTFRMQIQYLKNNFNIVHLESVLSIGDAKNKCDNNKQYCIITFDDGWKDFYGNAYPILKYYQVCSTVFLPTDFIGTNKLFWTDKLANIVKYREHSNNNIYNKSLLSNDIMKKIENIQGSNNFKIEKSIQILKHLPAMDVDNILEQLEYKWCVKNINNEGPSFLSWEEVKEMHNSGVVDFGSHTKSHQILTTISDDVIRQELIQSRNKLVENNIVSPFFVPFAYPNGNYTRKIANMVEKAGYSIALTTEKGWNRIEDDRSNIYELKRVGIHQDLTSSNPMLACRIFGIY
jgi:peptidoglycan/xylan/chitin deacetylase (PgdA/CDA1 family)